MKTLIIGLGSSGKAAAALLLSLGREVIGVDSNLSVVSAETTFPVFSDDTCIDFLEIEQVIVSPGISRQHPFYVKALDLGIEVIGEVELALRHLKGRLIAVTGTNGKTTVTLLIEHQLRLFGIQAQAFGNVGTPLTSYCLSSADEDVLVIELSSFQLETMSTQSFESGLILNITPDHLDRYASAEEYALAKCHLQQCLKSNADLYVHGDVLRDYGHLLDEKRVVRYDLLENFKDGFFDCDRMNILAAWAVVKGFGLNFDQFCEGLKTFKKPPHRIEFVAEIDGVSYYDDSKGTNVDAVLSAVSAMKGNVVLIAGGVDKGSSYAVWKMAFCGKVKKIIVLGQAADKMMEELQDSFEMKKVDSLALAVAESALFAKEGENVLLSPGCASYDMFLSYVHRGKEFKRHVDDLKIRRIKR
ncbi:MAG: UDP-N-acetylmuramoyl-L-alanine--D-glutamate ligase [Chlamydiota bacterium]